MTVTGPPSRVAPASRAGRRHGSAPVRPGRCRQRRLHADLRAKRTDVVRAGSTPRPGASRPASSAVYRRRRRVVGAAVAIAVTVLTLGAQATLTGSGSGPASAAGAGAVVAERTVRARSGDSLWTIAEEYRGEIGINRYVDELVELNGGTTIRVGQLVRLP